MFGDNKLLVCLWVHFQLIREPMIMSRYKETPKGRAEQERMHWEGRVTYPTHISGK